MRYTPVELRHVRLRRGLVGFRRHDVEELLEDVADSFEEVWRERGELTDKLEEVEKHLEELRGREQLLASTLVSAEKAAAEAKDAAKREAELIIAEAHHESRSILRTAQSERERLFAEARRVETLLRAALGMVDESKPEPAAVDREPFAGEADAAPANWPAREDTSEFPAVGDEHGPDDAREAPEHVAEPQEGQIQLPPPLPAAAEDDQAPSPRDFAWG
jgi:cell division septum initiation protein DivIVA